MSAKAKQICFLYLFLISNGNLLRYLGFAANGIGYGLGFAANGIDDGSDDGGYGLDGGGYGSGFAANGIGFAADGIGFAADGIGLAGDWYVFYIYFWENIIIYRNGNDHNYFVFA